MKHLSCASLLCLIFLVSLTYCVPSNAETIYSFVSQQHLEVFEYIEEEWPAHEPYKDYLKRCLEYQLNPAPRKKRSQAFKFLDTYYQNKNLVFHRSLDTSVWKDLNLYCGQEYKEEYIAVKIDRTSTELGRATLYGMLGQPHTDISTLEHIQHVIHALNDNPKLAKRLTQLMQELSLHETTLLSFWSNDLLYNAAQRHYYSLPFFVQLNNYELPLLFRSLMDHQETTAHAIAGLIATVVLPLYGLKLLVDYKAPEFVIETGKSSQGVVAPLFGILSTFGNNRYKAVLSFLSAFYCGLNTYRQCEWARDNFIIDQCLQTKLISIAKYLATVKEMTELLACHPALALLSTDTEKLEALWSHKAQQNPVFEKLLRILERKTFASTTSTFSNYGAILLAYHLMHEHKKEFEDAMVTIGYLDALLSIARLYQESKLAHASFCFAHYRAASTPFIDIGDFWNPLIDPASVITNSLCLGINGQPRNGIVTGPNEGGKSTLLKALAINLIMAQTLGIAPAHWLSFTPFDVISTYLNIADDLGSGNSLFKAEVLRMDSLIKKIETLAPGHFSFTIMDELLSGTSPKEGEAAAYSVAHHLGTFERSIAVLATHFPLLTMLAPQTGLFANYKVSVILKPDGSVEYPFKLEPGISEHNIALEILRHQGFAPSVIRTAYTLLGYE